MKIVGLTGGIATGKSTVVGFFEELGAKIIDADRIAREVVAPGKPALDDIVKAFGQKVLKKDGTLDRECLGEIIFNDQDSRKELNSITHPRIHTEMLRRIQKYREAGEKVVICDIPLLLEAEEGSSWLKPIIVVYADREAQIKRLMERNGYPRDEALTRLNSQIPIDEKVRKADIVIDNSGTIDEVKKRVGEVWKELVSD